MQKQRSLVNLFVSYFRGTWSLISKTLNPAFLKKYIKKRKKESMRHRLFSTIVRSLRQLYKQFSVAYYGVSIQVFGDHTDVFQAS